MTKNDVIKLIGYKGEYNKDVKSKLKKLLKKYHPDHYKDDKIFKIINEVKKDLELGIKFDYEEKDEIKVEKVNLSKEDILYYEDEILDLKKLRKVKELKINEKYNELSNILKDYNKLYEKDTKDNDNLYDGINEIKSLKKYEKYYIIIIFIALLFMLLFFIKKNIIYLITSVLLIIIIFILVYKLFKNIEKINKRNKKIILENKNIQGTMKDSNIRTEEINKEILLLEREVSKINDKIRLYKNRIGR